MKNKVFISYAYFETDVSMYNLTYFIENEVIFRKDIDYVFVINGYKCSILLPDLDNVKVIRRENTGYDFGAHSVALQSISRDYDYYFFMNSGVVGPIVPHYLKDTHWSEIFIKKINDKVKLVGTTIVCLPKEDAGGLGPKVEGFFFCTDREGLRLLEDEKSIFCIHNNKFSAIVNGEYGLSNCILRHGYSIDCMLHRYQNLNWTDKSNWKMNNSIHPSRNQSFYGFSIDPYEVIFHKWCWNFNNRNLNLVSDNNIKKYVSDTNFIYEMHRQEK
jgi:hypothetical protein